MDEDNMAQEFKKHFESYLLGILGNINDQNLIDKYQEEYEKLIDEYSKYNFLSKNEIDSIIELQLSDSAKKNKRIKRRKYIFNKSKYRIK